MRHKIFHDPVFLPTLRKGNFKQPVSILLIIAVLNLLSGCYYYKSVHSEDPISDIDRSKQDQSKFIVLHLGDKAWEFSEIEVTDQSIIGEISELKGHEYYKTTRPDQANRYKFNKKKPIDQREVLNEVHITVTEYVTLDGEKISIPIGRVNKVEIYDRAEGATIASWIFGGLGVTVGVAAVVFLIILLVKSSCPFVYVFDGTEYVFCGEIYSGSIHPRLERDDYLPLHELKEKDGFYSIHIKNEIREIQHTNLAELYVIDHTANTEVFIDKYGQAYITGKTILPQSATNLAGDNIMQLISSKDSLFYCGGELKKDMDPTDGAILEFELPEGVTNGQLIIRAKNSFWADYVISRFHGLLGSSYEKYMDKQNDLTNDELKARMLDHELPVSVYLEKNGEWEFQDYFNIAGPMALRDDILSMDLSGVHSRTVRIKLDYGLYFWELDYVGLSIEGEEAGLDYIVQMENAVDQNQIDVKELLISDDEQHYIQPDIGDAVEINFKVPPMDEVQRAVFLHSKGYYTIIRDQEGKPDMKALRSMNKEGGLAQFSLDLVQEIYTPSRN